MTAFALAEIASTSPAPPTAFDALLRAKLLEEPASHRDNVDDGRRSDDDDLQTFDAVRSLFGTAAAALKLELEHHDIGRPNECDDASCHCHWVPGRIEVMGKHTDYAGGNSLVCATSGRGMSMVSTFVRGEESSESWMRVTIVSVLPEGMEHHARNTAAPYQVEGRLVVHHTIHVRNGEDEADDDAKSADWTIYPTTVIKRLSQNFGLSPHLDEVDEVSRGNGGGGGHIFIALSSNLPPASGLSTSSAFVTGLFLVLNSHLHLTRTGAYRRAIGEDGDDGAVYNLSTYLGNVENGRDYFKDDVVLKGTVQGGVGTFGGSEDHAAILMGRRGEMRMLSFCPTRPAIIRRGCLERPDFDGEAKFSRDAIDRSVVRLRPDLTFVTAYSGARAEKAGGTEGKTDASMGYNSASELARKAFEAYFVGGDSEGLASNQTLADAVRWESKRLAAAGDFSCDESVKECIVRRIKVGALTMKQPNSLSKEEYSTALVERFEHFYEESEHLVLSVALAMLNGKYHQLALSVGVSHRGAVNGLKNQIEETAWLPLWAMGRENDLQTNPLWQCSKKQPTPDVTSDGSPRIKALAASAFGAGFGGSCWALVDRHQAPEFARQWQNAYDERFPAREHGRGLFFAVDPGPGAFCV